MGTIKKTSRGAKRHKSSVSLSKAQQAQNAQSFSAPELVVTQHIQTGRVATEQPKDIAHIDDEQLAYALSDEHLTAFSNTLRHILQQNHLETAAIAKALDVTENTIYRWLNGRSEPRQGNLRTLLEALPEHRNELTIAIRQTFPHALEEQQSEKREICKEVYQQILEMVTLLETDEEQIWHVAQRLFEHARLLLDRQQSGLSLTYASVMPPHADGYIHSLREVVTCGSYPWPSHYDDKVFLGRTTLAGHAAMELHSCIWHTMSDERILVEVDDYEHSACACPVMRFGRIGGVLVVSSTDPNLFRQPDTCSIVEEMSQLLAIALHDSDLHNPGTLRLVPMPTLVWQRRKISTTLVQRIRQAVRTLGFSRHAAEMHVIHELEQEFEEEGRDFIEQSESFDMPRGAVLF